MLSGFELVYEDLEREFTCDGLSPGHVYRVRLACSSIGGRSDVSYNFVFAYHIYHSVCLHNYNNYKIGSGNIY